MRERAICCQIFLAPKIRPWTMIDTKIICLGLTFIHKRFSEQQIRLQYNNKCKKIYLCVYINEQYNVYNANCRLCNGRYFTCFNINAMPLVLI